MYDLYDDPLTDEDMNALFWCGLGLIAFALLVAASIVAALVYWVVA